MNTLTNQTSTFKERIMEKSRQFETLEKLLHQRMEENLQELELKMEITGNERRREKGE
jgi:hypothetical protein